MSEMVKEKQAKPEEAGPAVGDRPLQEMRLRAHLPPVTRVSRKVMLGLGAVGGAGIGAALVLALKPQTHAAKPQLYNTGAHSTPDGLASLPHDYTGLPQGAPKLGPPLPGDLGRPILNAGAPAPTMGGADGQGTQTPEQQRISQDRDAARASRLFTATDAGAGGGEVAAVPSAANTTPGAAAAATSDATSPDHKLAFLNGAADHVTASPDRVEAPVSANVVQAGAVIAAALITGLRSDLPGEITAQVTEAVYDSPTGKVLLIPQGSRLVGQYDAQVAFGQSRALMVWTRLILPNGRSIVLERQPGADAEGYAGLEDRVDNHWGSMFKAAMLSTLLSVGSEAGTSDNENSLVQAIRQGASQSFSQAGQQVVGRSLNVQPTITIRPGFPVRVLVTRDLVLEPYQA